MRPLRSALLDHPWLVLAIGLAGLMLRLAVPAGFMPLLDHGQPTLTICPDYGAAASQSVRIASRPGAEHHGEGKPVAEGSCAFADLSLPLIGGADPILLAAALLFVIASALFAGIVLPPRTGLRLRPPLRGPPLPA